MKLFPGWSEKLEQVSSLNREPKIQFPLSTTKLSMQTQIVQTVSEAKQLVQFCFEAPVSYIGTDAEYRFAKAPIELNRGKLWNDIRSVHPFCLAVAVVSNGVIVKFAIDLRIRVLLPFIQTVLELPVPFVCHYAQSELFVFWQLDLQEPRIVFDTYLAEKALRLGMKKFSRKYSDTESEEIQKRKKNTQRDLHLMR